VRSCLYRQTYKGKTEGFEVFKIIIQPEINFNSIIYLEHERWPKDEDFGIAAWTCWTLDQAMIRFNILEGNDLERNTLAKNNPKNHPRVKLSTTNPVTGSESVITVNC
jgi:hypothetical protein